MKRSRLAIFQSRVHLEAGLSPSLSRQFSSRASVWADPDQKKQLRLQLMLDNESIVSYLTVNAV
ncbi:hypothetical protein D3C78_981120 [compost metagenome]